MSKAKVEQKLTTLLTVFTIIVLFWGQIGQSFLALGGAKLRKSSKVEFMGANSDFGGVEMVPVPPVLAQIVQNEPRWAKLALKKLGPIWLLGSIWLFSIYSVWKRRGTVPMPDRFSCMVKWLRIFLSEVRLRTGGSGDLS